MVTKKKTTTKKGAPKSKREMSGQLADEQLDKVTGGIGSATGGAGAGKAKLNEFTITQTIDKPSST